MAEKNKSIYLAVAGWNIPEENEADFPTIGSHLLRYSQVMPGVEINSSFYRDHRAGTYERWAGTVPSHFRFSVKLSKHLTHELAWAATWEEMRAALLPILELREKLGVLLVQFPPRADFYKEGARRFFGQLREFANMPVVCEPRHVSWLCADARLVFREFSLSKVIADPAPCPDPEGIFSETGSIRYFRLHGRPKIYFSPYSGPFLRRLASHLVIEPRPQWVVFDNTARACAIPNALSLGSLLATKLQAAG